MTITARLTKARSALGDVHPSWQSLLPWRDLVAILMEHPRAAPHLTRYLERRLCLPAASLPDSEAAWGQIANVSGEALCQAVIRSGLCFFHRPIRSPIAGAQVRALITVFGEQDYDFALRRAPALARRFRIDEAMGDADQAVDTRDAAVLYQDVRYRGMVVLAQASRPGGLDYTRHLLFRLPKDWSKDVLTGRLPLSSEVALSLLLAVLEELDIRPQAAEPSQQQHTREAASEQPPTEAPETPEAVEANQESDAEEQIEEQTSGEAADD
ncbi:MAG: hypothetical protein WED00_13605 [Aquisalimonadaceae bacterium]